MRHLFIGIFLISSFYSCGQVLVTKDKLDSIILKHQYHCDTINKKRQDFIRLGEEPMRLAYVEYKRHAKRITIKGQVIDRTNEPIPLCPIYIADNICSLQLIGTTDKNGTFNLTIPYINLQSIYITYVGFYDIELPLSKLNSH